MKVGKLPCFLSQALAHINFEAARMKGNVSTESDTSSREETGFGPQGKAVHPSVNKSLAHHDPGAPGKGSNLPPTLNPLAASFTPSSQAANIAAPPPPASPASDAPTVQPANARSPTRPSLQRFVRDLGELKSGSDLSDRARLAKLHDQRRQLLSHMSTAKAEIDELEGRLPREESVEGSREILIRLGDLRELHEWLGDKWTDLGEEMADLEAEVAIPGSR